MTSTRSASAIGLPVLRSTALPELEGTALRLHVSPIVTARWPCGDRGYALVSLTPGDDPDEPAALVRLPLAQVGALAKACAAFNVIMDAAERDAAAPAPLLAPPPPPPPPAAAPRAQALVTAAAQVTVLAGVLPAVLARCLGLL